MKEVWFDYLKSNKQYWSRGMTAKRLDKVKDAVFADKDIMWDLLTRHGGANKTPYDMMNQDKEWFNHCMSNFICNIHYKMMDLKMIKG